MKFNTAVGAFRHTDHGIVMTVKSALALNYGDIVIYDQTNNDTTTGIPSVQTTTTADSVNVAGVVCSRAGIPAGGVGEIMVFGFADVNTASATSNFAAGAALTTSTTAGAAADGTETLLCHFGKVHYSPNDTTTVLVAWVNVL